MEKGLVSSYVLMNFQFLFANLLNIIFCIMSDWEAGDAFFSSLLHVLSQFIVFVSVLLQVVLGFFLQWYLNSGFNGNYVSCNIYAMVSL